MFVVSNTSPILNLAIVEQLFLLNQQFNKIFIPVAVLNELKIDENRPGYLVIREALIAGWIQVQEVSDKPFVQILKQTLDHEEAEAIALAIELKADWTLLDEREGRKVAKSFELKVTGILGILLRAKQSGVLKDLQAVIDDLVSKAG